jgi:hypothetical protein
MSFIINANLIQSAHVEQYRAGNLFQCCRRLGKLPLSMSDGLCGAELRG